MVGKDCYDNAALFTAPMSLFAENLYSERALNLVAMLNAQTNNKEVEEKGTRPELRLNEDYMVEILDQSVDYHKNGDVSFFVLEPDVSEVEVEVDGRRYKLTKLDKPQAFKGTFSGIKPGIHMVKYFFDGHEKVYERGFITDYAFGLHNIIKVPAAENEFYMYRDVPHGSIRNEFYWSPSVDDILSAVVYTPPGYDHNDDRKYPVFYLQLGTLENETQMLNCNFNLILDNLIAEGKCPEMILVLVNTMASVTKDMSGEVAVADFVAAAAKTTLEDCVPYINGRFRVSGDNIIHGFSIGELTAAELLKIGGDTFRAVGELTGLGGSAEKIAFEISEDSLTRERAALCELVQKV